MRSFLALASLAVLAACASVIPPAPGPAPAPPATVPAPTPAPAPATPPPPAFGGDWRDWPVARGTWVYRQDGQGTIALFGARESDAELTLRCDRLTRQVYLSRRGATPGPMTIRTSTTARAHTARPAGGAQPYMAVALAVNDPILDAIGYSRGRFVVEMPPLAPLVVPTWAEVQRVTEDCRR
ncbi:hypothetical protein FPZ54_06385 [Sphingomonas suaedae]|uniref:Lipoprotein n=1 Tax=Sphingomonas suaedae TaxID=2599297 RepID=A0A518RE24_9SPHN|nr:hypothetical protein [Sphingomonas suaedae]QDX25683.1 hypothetical protein FPZ54_06385 [Sphingomonas suaedae]